MTVRQALLCRCRPCVLYSVVCALVLCTVAVGLAVRRGLCVGCRDTEGAVSALWAVRRVIQTGTSAPPTPSPSLPSPPVFPGEPAAGFVNGGDDGAAAIVSPSLSYSWAALAEPALAAAQRAPPVHFVWCEYAPRNMTYTEFLAVKAASIIVARGRVHLHVLAARALPMGPWWSAAAPYVRVVSVADDVQAFVHARPGLAASFVSDYVRLRVLHQYGGVSFDLNVLVVRSLDGLLAGGADVVLGMESDDDTTFSAVANAVMIARPGAVALRSWIDALEGLSLSEWTTMGTVYGVLWPKVYAEFFSDDVLMLNRHAFYWPAFTQVDALYEDAGLRLSNTSSLTLHLWSSVAATRRYARLLTDADAGRASSSLFGDAVRALFAL